MNRARTAPRDAGLTLIEVMVSVLLAAILMAGVFNMMIGQTRSYDTQLKATVKQENLWAAMEYLQRQIRMAGFGFGGCPNGVVEVWNAGSTSFVPSQIALQVFDNCSLYQDTSTYPPSTLSNCTARNGTDSFAVSYSADANTSGLGVINLVNQTGTNLNATSCGTPPIADDDYIALWEPNSPTPCILFKVTKDASSTKKNCKIQVNPSAPENPPPGLAEFRARIGKDAFPPGTVVLRLGPAVQAPLKFGIDSSVNPPRLVQWRDSKANAEVIAEGIEDMQISFACDLNKDGSQVEGPSNADEWAYNVAETWTGAGGTLGETTCGTGVNIAAVRITLVGRSLSPEAGVKNQRPALENHAVGTQDNYARAVLSATIKPRNIMPIP